MDTTDAQLDLFTSSEEDDGPELPAIFEIKSGCKWIDGDGHERVQCCAQTVHYKTQARADRMSDYCEAHYGQVYQVGSALKEASINYILSWNSDTTKHRYRNHLWTERGKKF